MNINIFKDVDTIILAGGLGTRLRALIGNNPKCLTLVNNIPFIDILIDNCIEYGIENFIISVGYKKNKVIKHLRNKDGCKIIFSKEDEPLGTGGAIRNAKNHLKSDHVMIMNGDSFIDLNFIDLYNFHLSRDALITLVGAKAQSNSDVGSITFDKDHRITRFEERPTSLSQKYINAGIYIFRRSVFDSLLHHKKFSIEKDFFPNIKKHGFYIFKSNAKLYDIGTPERLQLFESYIKTINE